MLRLKLLISIMIACTLNTLDAQSITGGSSLSFETPNNDGAKDYGFTFLFRSNYGLQVVDTNVTAWTDVISGRRIEESITTNQPCIYSSYTTNAFPAVVFENRSPANRVRNLHNHGMAAMFTGNKAYTFYTLQCSQTNAGGFCIIAGGYSVATNANASQFQLRPNAGTATSKVIMWGADTNQATTGITLTGGATTNIYTWIGYSSDGVGSYTIMENLKANTTSGASIGQTTLDTFALGCLFRTNFTPVNAYSGGVTVIACITNKYTNGTGMTNDMNWLNTNYLNGVYKVY